MSEPKPTKQPNQYRCTVDTCYSHKVTVDTFFVKPLNTCVIDTNDHDECIFAKPGMKKEDCPHWRLIK